MLIFVHHIAENLVSEKIIVKKFGNAKIEKYFCIIIVLFNNNVVSKFLN